MAVTLRAPDAAVVAATRFATMCASGVEQEHESFVR